MPMPLRLLLLRLTARLRAGDAEAAELLALLTDPHANRADFGALTRRLAHADAATTALPRRIGSALALPEAAGPALLAGLADRLGPDEVARALDSVPALEPRTRGPRCGQSAALARPGDTVSVRQGRLGDCWFVAVMLACESARPGFLSSLVTELPGGLVAVRLHSSGPRSVIMSRRVPPRNRAGDERLRPTTASLVEKAAALAYGLGSYRRLQFDFAGTGLRLLTGSRAYARPVPRSATTVAGWLDAGRPVLASTLVRPWAPVRIVPREDDPRRGVTVISGHVYVILGVARVDEDGRPAGPDAPLRIHLRNPQGGPETEPRRTDLHLSARQFRAAFLSVNVGPRLSPPASSPGIVPASPIPVPLSPPESARPTSAPSGDPRTR